MIRVLLAALCLLALADVVSAQPKSCRPNVIVVITDDQGHGDLGFHGNPVIKTPHLDRLARQSVRMRHFYVSPVCSPTRASLLTGRYNYRTGVVDTFIGRSMMHPDETTLAELLAAAGYRTGIFGKWHLGDCYPLRATDQGFQESLVLRGGGIGQPSDPPEGTSYFDPVLQHNGQQVRKKGYCSDVFTDAAIDFIAKSRDGPFFCYLAFNAPHTPLEVPEKYRQMYAGQDLSPARFPTVGQPLPAKAFQDETARVYGMVTNIDDNVGRLLAKLDELGIAEDTIVIFLTDNGPQQPRYNSGMRQRKGSVHEGGTRVPFFVRWPGRLKGDRDIDRIAAHIDVTPTLLDACGVQRPASLRLDGKSLLPLWDGAKVDWPDRTLYFQWHRGDVPELYRACAARSQKYRLVQPDGVPEGSKFDKTKFMLFDIESDPYEMNDLAAKHPDVVAEMKRGYEAWFKGVSSTRGYDPPRIRIGSERAPLTVLTRQDWRGSKAGWTKTSVGHWEVHVERAGAYEVKLRLPAEFRKGEINLRVGKLHKRLVADGPGVLTWHDAGGVALPEGPARLEAWVVEGEQVRGMHQVEVRRKE